MKSHSVRVKLTTELRYCTPAAPSRRFLRFLGVRPVCLVPVADRSPVSVEVLGDRGQTSCSEDIASLLFKFSCVNVEYYARYRLRTTGLLTGTATTCDSKLRGDRTTDRWRRTEYFHALLHHAGGKNGSTLHITQPFPPEL